MVNSMCNNYELEFLLAISTENNFQKQTLTCDCHSKLAYAGLSIIQIGCSALNVSTTPWK